MVWYKFFFQSPFSGDFLCFNANVQRLSGATYTFNLHFQETFFVSEHACLRRHARCSLSISIFRRLSLFRNIDYTVHHYRVHTFQSPFSGDFLCFPDNPEHSVLFDVNLSISIFRRLSLFRIEDEIDELKTLLIFQSPFSGDFLCFPSEILKYIQQAGLFQSPFSGDFLCFIIFRLKICQQLSIFQSPFSGDFLCFTMHVSNNRFKNINFQSPFSGDFLCFGVQKELEEPYLISFNLHFQETFFVSKGGDIYGMV